MFIKQFIKNQGLRIFFGFWIGLFLSFSAYAATTMSVGGEAVQSLDDIHYGESDPSEHTKLPQNIVVENTAFLIKMRGECFGRNLRNVESPLRRSSTRIRIVIKTDQGTFKLEAPTRLVVSVPDLAPNFVGAYCNGGGGLSSIPSATYKGITGQFAAFQFDVSNVAALPTTIQSIRYYQSGFAPLAVETSKQTLSRFAGGKQLQLNFRAPGEKDFCGGYYSPLMAFFNHKRPSFKNVSEFPLIDGELVHWPEPKHAGYFLVLDRDGDGMISAANELFINSKDHRNGFEHLATLDTNKDRVIDREDKLFHQLKLWKDVNGNGISEKSELLSLKKKNVQWISLRSQSIEEHYGNYAKAVERTVFGYKNAQGRFKHSKMVDFWFKTAGPVPKRTVTSKIKR